MMQTQSSHTYTTGKIEARVFGMDALRHLEDKFPSGIPEDSEHRNLRPDASGHGIQDAALARKGIEREFLSSELNLPEEERKKAIDSVQHKNYIELVRNVAHFNKAL